MYTAHDPVSGPGFFAVNHTGIESGQTVEIPADWKIPYLMCSIVPDGASVGMVEVQFSVFGTDTFYASGQVIDLAAPEPVIFDDCIDRLKLVPTGVDGSWTASVPQAKA